jgi:hypothetical protein
MSVFEDEFYTVSKTRKNRFTYELKDGVAKALNPCRNTGIAIDDKVSSDYLINKLIDIEKRLAFNENKKHKKKKKINKIFSDIYEYNIEDKSKSNDTKLEIEDKSKSNDTKLDFEDKLKDIIEEQNDESQSQENNIAARFRSNQRLRCN